MIDLTPLEVRKKKGDFRRVMRGYDSAMVDDFLDLVADRLDELVRENLALTERTTRQEQQVADYREREQALTDALVTAQEMREEIRRQTSQEADLLRRSAEQETSQLRASATQEAAQLRSAAQQEASSLKSRTEQELNELRSALRQEREREEEALRTLRARQEQFVTTYRSFLEEELNELGGISRALGLAGRGQGARHADGATRETPDEASAGPGAAPTGGRPGAGPGITGSAMTGGGGPGVGGAAGMAGLSALTSLTLTETPGAGAPPGEDLLAGSSLTEEPVADEPEAMPDAPASRPAPLGMFPDDDMFEGEDAPASDDLLVSDELLASHEDALYDDLDDPVPPVPFEPEPFEPEPFEPEPGEAAPADADAFDPDTFDYGAFASIEIGNAEGADEGADEDAGAVEHGSLDDVIMGPFGFAAEPATEPDSGVWPPEGDEPGPVGLGEVSPDASPVVEADDVDEEVNRLLRNAAAAGYSLDEIEDELLLGDDAVVEDEDDIDEGDGWLPTLLDDEP